MAVRVAVTCAAHCGDVTCDRTGNKGCKRESVEGASGELVIESCKTATPNPAVSLTMNNDGMK